MEMLVGVMPVAMRLAGAAGGVISDKVLNTAVAGAEALPAASLATTETVYEVPSESPVSVNAEVPRDVVPLRVRFR